MPHEKSEFPGLNSGDITRSEISDFSLLILNKNSAGNQTFEMKYANSVRIQQKSATKQQVLAQ